MPLDLKGRLLSTLFSRWRRACAFEPGYTVVLITPMDMPFLLRFSLEGLQRIDLANCRRILVVPDPWGEDGGAALRRVLEDFDDPRLAIAPMGPIRTRLTRMMKPPGSAATHWSCVVQAVEHTDTEHAFLHDADAFHLDADGLERQYAEMRDRDMNTLGVTPRWDPFFLERSLTIPGTWELMFSTRWARSRSPYELKGRVRDTTEGPYEFDSMLYPQYLDHDSGRIGVMSEPPRFVHFSGAIFTYRTYRDRAGEPVKDELFRVLLLSALETIVPASDGRRATPTVDELAAGLTDPDAPVRYDTDVARRTWPEFRGMIDELNESPMFAGERAERMNELLRPFDEHWARVEAESGEDAAAPGAASFRRMGLG